MYFNVILNVKNYLFFNFYLNHVKSYPLTPIYKLFESNVNVKIIST